MVLCICLNPCLDRIYYFNNFQTGELNRAKRVVVSAGGKGVNVARVLSILGQECILTGFFAGLNGDWIISEAKKYNIETHPIYIEGATRSTINIIENTIDRETEITEPGPMINKNSVAEFINKYSELLPKVNTVVLSGGSPQGVDSQIYSTIVKMAIEQGKKCILDASSERLVEGIKGKPTLIKPNRRELNELLHKNIENDEDLYREANKLSNVLNGYTVVSMGDKGGIIAYNNKIYHADSPRKKVVNTIGSGDSMIAGMVYALEKGLEIKDVLRWGVAVGAANTLQEKAGYIDMQDVKRLYNQINVSVSDISEMLS